MSWFSSAGEGDGLGEALRAGLGGKVEWDPDFGGEWDRELDWTRLVGSSDWNDPRDWD